MKTFPVWWTENGACACPAGVECHSPGKHPLTRNGVKDATDDAQQMQAWREQYPLANWSVATGNGLLVVDLDVKPGKNGIASIKKLGTFPPTRTVRTGSGGLHVYLQVTDSYPNTAGKLGAGVDTRCDGGYVLIPPSGHISGGQYELISDLPIAPAPAWLLAALRPVASVPVPLSQRGYFPPASAAVLEAARSALASHGPAVQGEGGDDHTFIACAILTHDFALTDAEAWALIKEWNEECDPPWSAEDLHAKLRSGVKSGSAAYGCKRPLEVLEAVRKRIEDWDRADETMLALIEDCKPLAGMCTSKTQWGMIQRILSDATGMTAKVLDLPKFQAERIVLEQGQIMVTTELAKVADEAIQAISEQVFSRNGVLCEVVKTERTFIKDLPVGRIRDLMSQCATWVRPDPDKGQVSQAPPIDIASMIHDRPHSTLRVLEAVTTAPVFLADGTILQERGYSEQARVYLEPDVTVDVLESPTLEHAQQSVEVFRDLLCDFHFLEDADFSSWLAGLLTPLVKAATKNAPAPLFCISASNPGIGKTLLTKAISDIVTGADPEIRPYNSRDPAEWGKRLTAFVKAAAPVNVFDNVNGAIGDEGLDRLITSSTWSDRQLGASEAPPLPVVSTWFATGNNIEPVGDTVRRVLMIRLVVDVERPQERTGFKYSLEGGHALAHRSELLSAALTILRAYHCAGRPEQALPPWGSFTVWSSLVRGALVWAGCADPFLTQQRAARDLNEPENEAHDFWLGIVAESDGTASGIAALCAHRGAQDVLNLRDSVTAFGLRKLIARFVDKPRQGKRIVRQGNVYGVESV